MLILRSVLDYSARETADMLGITVAAANSILQRARRAVRRQVPSRSQQQTVRDLGDERVRDLVSRYARAFEAADLDGLLALLDEDATWSMPPMPAWYRGREAIAAFLEGYPLRHTWRHLPARANGQPAVGCYVWNEHEGAYLAAALDVLTLEGDRIVAVMGFVDPRAVALCGLPARLPAGAAPRGRRRDRPHRGRAAGGVLLPLMSTGGVLVLAVRNAVYSYRRRRRGDRPRSRPGA